MPWHVLGTSPLAWFRTCSSDLETSGRISSKFPSPLRSLDTQRTLNNVRLADYACEMTSGYKKPGILRASFDYQDLCAICLLIDFYRQPDLYQWIELDSDDASFASIDDIVACRMDGRFEISQVKFTVNPDDPANQLDWDWLLKRSKQGRSLLQKWEVTVDRHLAINQLELAELLTDRRPSGNFAAALEQDRIRVERIETGILASIEAQLGSAAKVASFFANFRFRHSQPHLDDLEYELQSRLIPSDTDYPGWIALVRAVKEWATLKLRPEPDGRVRHAHIRAALSRERPRPLQQNFDIPPGYRPPDVQYDREFREHVLCHDGTTVLWGPPGRGKSTYLSHCFRKFETDKQICIRHHYFLRLSDRGTARFFFQEIERSLIRQLEEQLPDLQVAGQSLERWLDAAAQRAGETGRRLIVMIDGLDHVWREGRSLDHMQQLFAHLLPVREHMHLVVGTQKIAPKNLPHRLLQFCPEEAWRALPLMSANEIAHWLSVQHAAGRLTLVVGSNPPAAIQVLAAAFHRVTGGLPLQLIYAFETLTRPGGSLTEAAVLGLPGNPSGDIRDYYRSLWVRVSASARSILHGLASLEFPLPAGGIHQCFKDMAGAPEAIEEIDHLLDHREIGAYPFHGSIFVFVREQADHQQVAASQQQTFLAWLDGPAPAYWKWAWTWITQARFGNPSPLLDGPDRAWTLDALCAGQPPEQIEYILQEAETLAFYALDFARAAELRSLWIRASNASEFQTTKFADFVEATLRHADNDYRLVQLRSSISAQNPGVLLGLLRALAPEAAEVAAEEVLNDLNRRAREAHLDEQSNVDWPATLVRVLPYLSNIDPKRLKAYAHRQGREDSLIGTAIDEAVLAERYGVALAFAALHRGRECDGGLFALLCLDGADPRSNSTLRGHAARPQFHALYAVRGWPLPTRRPLSIQASEFVPLSREVEARASTGPRLYQFFFRVLSAALGGRAARVRLIGLDELSDQWMREVLQTVAMEALRLAERLERGQPPPPLAAFFRSIVVPPQTDLSYDAQSLLIGIRLGLRDIAVDLQLLRRATDARLLIEPEDLPDIDQPLWIDSVWLEHAAIRRLPIHSAAGAEALLQRISAALDAEVSEFMERSDLCIQASLFALDHKLGNRATEFLARSGRCLLGYGWRKDPFAFELLEALRLMFGVDPAWAAEQLMRLAPAYAAVTDYTDGDETNHAKSEYYGCVIDMRPDKAGALYGELIRSDNWSSAERLLSHITDKLDPSDPRDRALLSTFIQPRELDEVRALTGRHGTAATSLVSDLHRRIGYSRPHALKDRGSSTNYSDKVPRSAPQPAKYPPDQLAAYRDAVRDAAGYGWKNRAIERWLRHWRRSGEGREALQALHQLITGDHSSYELDKAYDLAFSASLELEGRQAAFFWLVSAQRHRYGWQRWYTSAPEAERRLDLAAKHYRERWADFVIESSAPVIFNPGERGTIVMGHSRLVSFLLKVGQADRARQLTAKLVNLMLAEVEEQPLSLPGWTQ